MTFQKFNFYNFVDNLPVLYQHRLLLEIAFSQKVTFVIKFEKQGFRLKNSNIKAMLDTGEILVFAEDPGVPINPAEYGFEVTNSVAFKFSMQ